MYDYKEWVAVAVLSDAAQCFGSLACWWGTTANALSAGL